MLGVPAPDVCLLALSPARTTGGPQCALPRRHKKMALLRAVQFYLPRAPRVNDSDVCVTKRGPSFAP